MPGVGPDFNRVITALHHEEPDRVPLAEILVNYQIMSQLLNKTVNDDTLSDQVEFWMNAGYDFIPLTVGVMRPGGVTKDSQISRVIQEYFLQSGEEESEDAWNI